jgi:hypothetical protein
MGNGWSKMVHTSGSHAMNDDDFDDFLFYNTVNPLCLLRTPNSEWKIIVVSSKGF